MVFYNNDSCKLVFILMFLVGFCVFVVVFDGKILLVEDGMLFFIYIILLVFLVWFRLFVGFGGF